MSFFVGLTVGFVYEIGQNAINIEIKQTVLSSTNNTPIIDVFNYLNSVRPHAFTSSSVQSTGPLPRYNLQS
jgi:hypothetical protein